MACLCYEPDFSIAVVNGTVPARMKMMMMMMMAYVLSRQNTRVVILPPAVIVRALQSTAAATVGGPQRLAIYRQHLFPAIADRSRPINSLPACHIPRRSNWGIAVTCSARPRANCLYEILHISKTVQDSAIDKRVAGEETTGGLQEN